MRGRDLQIRDSLPSKRETMNQCWIIVGPSSTMLAQHESTLVTTSCVSWLQCQCRSLTPRRSAARSLPTCDVDPVLVECWPSVSDAGSTFNQHRVNVSFQATLVTFRIMITKKNIFIRRRPMKSGISSWETGRFFYNRELCLRFVFAGFFS